MTTDQGVHYVAICVGCEPLLPVPFSTEEERVVWCSQHVSGTGHSVVSIDQVDLGDPILKDIEGMP